MGCTYLLLRQRSLRLGLQSVQQFERLPGDVP
jgi:hypothetical protein